MPLMIEVETVHLGSAVACYAVRLYDGFALSVRARRGLARLYLFEKPNHAHAKKRDQGQPPKNIDKSPQQGLRAQLAIELPLRCACRVGGGGLVRQVALDGAQPLLKLRAGPGHGVQNLVLMVVGAAR